MNQLFYSYFVLPSWYHVVKKNYLDKTNQNNDDGK